MRVVDLVVLVGALSIGGGSVGCARETACADGTDNDHDGDADCDDADCAETPACSGGDQYEGDVAGECSDGIDNDGDGQADCHDPDCWAAPDCSGDDDDDTQGDDDDDTQGDDDDSQGDDDDSQGDDDDSQGDDDDSQGDDDDSQGDDDDSQGDDDDTIGDDDDTGGPCGYSGSWNSVLGYQDAAGDASGYVCDIRDYQYERVGDWLYMRIRCYTPFTDSDPTLMIDMYLTDGIDQYTLTWDNVIPVPSALQLWTDINSWAGPIANPASYHQCNDDADALVLGFDLNDLGWAALPTLQGRLAVDLYTGYVDWHPDSQLYITFYP